MLKILNNDNIYTSLYTIEMVAQFI